MNQVLCYIVLPFLHAVHRNPKDESQKLFTHHFYRALLFPHYNTLFPKKIYLYCRAWKTQKGTLWEQKTIHTKFHTDTAPFPRIGDHLMKCISQNLWGRVKLQSNIIKSAAVLLFLIGRAVSLDLRKPKHTGRAELTLTGIGQSSTAVKIDQHQNCYWKDCTHL